MSGGASSACCSEPTSHASCGMHTHQQHAGASAARVWGHRGVSGRAIAADRLYSCAQPWGTLRTRWRTDTWAGRKAEVLIRLEPALPHGVLARLVACQVQSRHNLQTYTCLRLQLVIRALPPPFVCLPNLTPTPSPPSQPTTQPTTVTVSARPLQDPPPTSTATSLPLPLPLHKATRHTPKRLRPHKHTRCNPKVCTHLHHHPRAAARQLHAAAHAGHLHGVRAHRHLTACARGMGR